MPLETAGEPAKIQTQAAAPAALAGCAPDNTGLGIRDARLPSHWSLRLNSKYPAA